MAKTKGKETKGTKESSLSTYLHVLTEEELLEDCVDKLAKILVYYPGSFNLRLKEPQVIDRLLKKISDVEDEMQKKRN